MSTAPPGAAARERARSVGGTPLVHLERLSREAGVELHAKLEQHNPSGSLKDRVAEALVDDAEAQGKLAPGGTIVEPTAGNTGPALARVGALRGYRVILTMPEATSPERVALARAYGAEVVRTPGSLMRAAVEQAEVLAASLPGAVELGQFSSPANPAAHERSTGPELWRDLDGRLDVLVAGIGTGGTVTGIGRYLRRQGARVRVVGVEPAEAAVLGGGPAGRHRIEGLGAGFVPAVLERELVDEIVAVTTADAFAHARRLARVEGVLAGPSSGAVLCAALALARRPELAGQRFALVLADGGLKYLSTGLYDDDS
ncbi:MAG: cysteine synthase family protein [Polyangiaceae bacterium]|nr:cysteine synthase family protein [Polyangiaceae bacterium]